MGNNCWQESFSAGLPPTIQPPCHSASQAPSSPQVVLSFVTSLDVTAFVTTEGCDPNGEPISL